MTSAAVGIIANPASGKDIRRLVAHASVFDNEEKRNIVRRAILGAVATGVQRFVMMPDQNALIAGALDGLDIDATVDFVETPRTASALDTERAASAMRDANCGAVITLGGDGTNRATARGWIDLPLVAISTGTNNVFPRMLEGTTAGAAAGLVATGKLALADVAERVKAVHVDIEGEPPDLALIDAVLLNERFVGARAIWHPERIRTIVLTRAEPAAMGMSAIGGLLHPVTDADDHGLAVQLGEGGEPLLAPIAPGLYRPVPIRSCERLPFDQPLTVEGPGILALDGERERLLKPGQHAHLTVRRDGPHVINVTTALRRAACRGLFRMNNGGELHGR